MLEIYARELVGIGMFLKRKEGTLHKGYLLVEKKVLEGLLDKNAYDTAAHKLKIWKALKWIDTEKDRRVTKRVYDGDSKSYKPFVKIDAAVMEQLQELIEIK